MSDSNKANMKQPNPNATNPQQKQPWGGKPTAGTTSGQPQQKQPWNPDQQKDKTKK